MTQHVAQGQQITESDITEVMVAQDSSINYVTWSQRGLLSQYTTETDLVPGTLLIGPMLTTTPAASSDLMTVPVTLKSGQYPPSIGVGDTVSAYYVGPPSSGSSSAFVSILLATQVKILSLPSLNSSSSADSVFEVSVDKADATNLLIASAQDHLVFTSGANAGSASPGTTVPTPSATNSAVAG